MKALFVIGLLLPTISFAKRPRPQPADVLIVVNRIEEKVEGNGAALAELKSRLDDQDSRTRQFWQDPDKWPRVPLLQNHVQQLERMTADHAARIRSMESTINYWMGAIAIIGIIFVFLGNNVRVKLNQMADDAV